MQAVRAGPEGCEQAARDLGQRMTQQQLREPRGASGSLSRKGCSTDDDIPDRGIKCRGVSSWLREVRTSAPGCVQGRGRADEIAKSASSRLGKAENQCRFYSPGEWFPK